MRRIIRRKLSGHVVGIILSLIGLGILFVVFGKAWSTISSSSDVLSSLWSYISTEQIQLGSTVTLKLFHLFIVGAIFLVTGVIVFTLSRQVFYFSDAVLLQCPYCKNHWKTSRAKGWAECPHCRQFIRPELVKKGPS